MEHVLLVWNEHPEEVQLYVIPADVAAQHADRLAEAHGRMINSDEMNDGLLFVSAATQEHWAEKGFERFLGIFVPYRVDDKDSHKDPITGVTITKVYSSGIVL